LFPQARHNGLVSRSVHVIFDPHKKKMRSPHSGHARASNNQIENCGFRIRRTSKEEKCQSALVLTKELGRYPHSFSIGQASDSRNPFLLFISQKLCKQVSLFINQRVNGLLTTMSDSGNLDCALARVNILYADEEIVGYTIGEALFWLG
jgi:hypothetical protein